MMLSPRVLPFFMVGDSAAHSTVAEMVDGHLFHARNVEFAVIGWRDLMRAVGSVLRLDRHRPKMASVCIEQPRFASAHIDIHSDAVGQVVPALKEMLLIVFLPVASSSGPLFWAIISRRGYRSFRGFRIGASGASVALAPVAAVAGVERKERPIRAAGPRGCGPHCDFYSIISDHDAQEAVTIWTSRPILHPSERGQV